MKKMKRLLFVLLTLIISFTSFKEKPKSKVILAVVAHPDDEGAIPQVLAKYGKENKVYVIIATDGRYGVMAGYSAGDTLANIRKKESECACKTLGIQPPIFLGFHDGMGLMTGMDIGSKMGEYFKQTVELKEKLKEKIEQLNPDIIITFGPDGDTGHPDHRIIGAITTEIILREDWVKRFPLYYIAWSQKDSDKYKKATGFGLGTVNSKLYNVTINYSEEDEDKGLASLKCYVSQGPPLEEINKLAEAEKKDKTNTLYFRQLAVSANKKTGF
jgi:LmbE family N-acetylglucosaminyl deacetylase